MQIIDLSHEINSKMTIYPGTKRITVIDHKMLESFGVCVQEYAFNGHTGTHLDVPKHISEHGTTTSTFDINSFCGKAIVCDVSYKKKGEIIEWSDIESIDMKTNNIDYILFYTGWSKYWNSDMYLEDYPVLTNEVVKKLSRMNIYGVGLDTISIDKIDGSLQNHHTLLGKGKIIVENLTNLEKLIGMKFIFTCFPLKFTGGDGSPIRATAILDL